MDSGELSDPESSPDEDVLLVVKSNFVRTEDTASVEYTEPCDIK